MDEEISLSLIEKYGWIEPVLRQLFEKYPSIKSLVKRYRNKRAQGKDVQNLVPINLNAWEVYKKVLYKRVDIGDIILIHSSTDGLEKIGATCEQCMVFLKKLVKEKSCTIVMACFPVTNLKKMTDKSRPYNPKKTLCWTGMLSNMFIADSECVRTRFPFNSLAAIGPKAREIMDGDLDAKLVYDKTSAWQYCCNHHAKILFLGIKASGANTMAIHMLPDYMGEEWPIDDWYEEKIYKVKLNEDIVDVLVKGQRGFWYKYVMEEGTSGKLKKAGLLEEYDIYGCNFGIVSDSLKMLNFLAEETRKGKLTYLIPRKYYKK